MKNSVLGFDYFVHSRAREIMRLHSPYLNKSQRLPFVVTLILAKVSIEEEFFQR
jgi:hypothetical protein